MKYAVNVAHLSKSFRVYRKSPGLMGSVKSIFKREYSDIKAVDDVSFKIEHGEFVGFIGPNGAGKTTTLKCLSGLLHPTSGEVDVLGYVPWERNREFLKQISLVMGQKRQLWWDLPPMDSFLINKEIYEIPDREFYEILDNLIDLLDLSRFVNIPVRKLSLGQRMKCELLASLLHSPKVHFLDEPTIGLDVVMQKKLRSFFKEYNEKYGTTVMLTSHYMDDVKELCKRVIIIDDGNLIYDGSIKSLVDKYVVYRNISFVTTKPVERADLEGLGIIVEHNDSYCVLKVKREDVLRVSSKLIKDFPIEDLNIDEMKLEDVIRILFDR